MHSKGNFFTLHFGLALIALFALRSGALAQAAASVVGVKTAVGADGVRPGSSIKVAALATIAPGFHINDHKPTLDYLIPTEWKIEPLGQVSVEKFVYPKGQLKKFAFSDTQLSVYEGSLAVGALLKVDRKARPGTYTLKGTFNYQACNDHACLPPKSVPVNLTVKVVGRGDPVKRANADVFNSLQLD
ncbi:MAG: protein-disulfide reductase DsbD domain-containing protein [Terriglobia bacterium]